MTVTVLIPHVPQLPQIEYMQLRIITCSATESRVNLCMQMVSKSRNSFSVCEFFSLYCPSHYLGSTFVFSGHDFYLTTTTLYLVINSHSHSNKKDMVPHEQWHCSRWVIRPWTRNPRCEISGQDGRGFWPIVSLVASLPTLEVPWIVVDHRAGRTSSPLKHPGQKKKHWVKMWKITFKIELNNQYIYQIHSAIYQTMSTQLTFFLYRSNCHIAKKYKKDKF